MNNIFARVHIRLQDLRRDEQGQDLTEYALMLSLICLSLISGISGIATSVNHTDRATLTGFEEQRAGLNVELEKLGTISCSPQVIFPKARRIALATPVASEKPERRLIS